MQPRTRTVEAVPNANLTPPWKLKITVENGAGDIRWTRDLASRVGAMGYTITKVGKADRFDYPADDRLLRPGRRGESACGSRANSPCAPRRHRA